MKSSKLITTIILLLVYGLSLFLLFIIPNTYSSTIWAVFIFDTIAFVSQLILWLTNFGGRAEVFYKYPSMTVSTGYLGVQFILCLVCAFAATVIPFKLTLVLNVILLVVAWILLIVTMFSVNHIEKIESRQIDHHIKLQ